MIRYRLVKVRTKSQKDLRIPVGGPHESLSLSLFSFSLFFIMRPFFLWTENQKAYDLDKKAKGKKKKDSLSILWRSRGDFAIFSSARFWYQTIQRPLNDLEYCPGRENEKLSDEKVLSCMRIAFTHDVKQILKVHMMRKNFELSSFCDDNRRNVERTNASQQNRQNSHFETVQYGKMNWKKCTCNLSSQLGHQE